MKSKDEPTSNKDKERKEPKKESKDISKKDMEYTSACLQAIKYLYIDVSNIIENNIIVRMVIL